MCISVRCVTRVDGKTVTHGKKVPMKVLRLFDHTPRTQRLYKSSHTAKEMTWHATGKCTEPGKMQHPVDGKAWKDFDTKYPDFAAEPRNVRLGLAADESSFMLTLLIPGPKSPGKDIDVYLRPLIDDLKDLWAKPGVETIDVATGLKFNMRAMIRQRHIDNDKDPEVSTTSELFALACGPTWTPISIKLLRSVYVDEMSADIAWSHGDNGNGEDHPPPHHIPTGCGGYFANRGKGKRKPSLGGRAAGRLNTRDKTWNLSLKEITVKKGLVPIRFEVRDKQTLMPLGDHAAHWSSYIGEVIRGVPLYYPSWTESVPKDAQAGIITDKGSV
ncbi:hypothetical protein Tco_0876124 [Tanacetum coccineum]|uniref:Uncharacterized protein n=1 Tax=Tanacetum coccineum TaxID=301880 RepID=A0ABQ5BUU8_9ASTR